MYRKPEKRRQSNAENGQLPGQLYLPTALPPHDLQLSPQGQLEYERQVRAIQRDMERNPWSRPKNKTVESIIEEIGIGGDLEQEEKQKLEENAKRTAAELEKATASLMGILGDTDPIPTVPQRRPIPIMQKTFKDGTVTSGKWVVGPDGKLKLTSTPQPAKPRAKQRSTR